MSHHLPDLVSRLAYGDHMMAVERHPKAGRN